MAQDIVLTTPKFDHPRYRSPGHGPGGIWGAFHEFPVPADTLGTNVPTVYGWYAVPLRDGWKLQIDRAVLLYVGQTINLFERTRAHANTRDRASVGRRALRWQLNCGTRPGEDLNLYRLALGWIQYGCDCPLDVVERHLIETQLPKLNTSPGNDCGKRTLDYPCDELCINSRSNLPSGETE